MGHNLTQQLGRDEATPVAQDRRCLRCGQMIPGGEATCPACGSRQKWWMLSRETVLGISLGVLALLFAVTGFATRAYREKQHALKQEWLTRGEADLASGRSDQAIEDFRTALAYAPDDRVVELRLAQALLAANQFEGAQTYFDSLWQDDPESGIVNLELGRLAVQRGSVSDALRYYHNAIYGRWDQDPDEARRNARLELYQFLEKNGEKSQAQAELMALAASLPRDPSLDAQVGQLFLASQDYDHALKEFQEALKLNSKLEAAWAGAGEAEFHAAKYREAERYLERAVRESPGDGHARQLLQTTRSVLTVDPFESWLDAKERNRRVVAAYEQAMTRLRNCAERQGDSLGAPKPQTALERVYADGRALRPLARETSLRRDPDLISTIMDWVADAEKAATSYCGPPTGLDQAIMLALEKHGH